MRRGSLTVICFALALACAAPAYAAPCSAGKRRHLVARGESLLGVPWRINAKRYKTDNVAFLDVRLITVGYPESGFSAGMALPISRRFIFSAVGGSYEDPPPEIDLAGLAARRVATLEVKMKGGGTETFVPRLAPKRLRKHFCWARRLRFFDEYFAGDPTPTKMTARNARGDVLAVKHSNRGSFF